MHFHILGTGAIGCHLASRLKPNHKVTLLLRSQARLDEFASKHNTITYMRSGKPPVLFRNFDASITKGYAGSIETLVVTTKAHQVVEAVRPIASCLTGQSTVILLQNGMGVAEALKTALFASATAPRILLGVNQHAVERVEPFKIAHYSGWAESASLAFGEFQSSKQPTVDRVLQAFLDIPDLSAAVLSWPDVQSRMMKKLVVNAAINPVAALLGCRNGMLLNMPTAVDLISRICKEAGLVLPLAGNHDSLTAMVTQVAKVTAQNKCSMAQDIEAQRSTEIDFINGYLCQIAEQRGLELPTNRTLVELIHAKQTFNVALSK